MSPGETPTFRAPGVSPGENTHIPRTGVSPEVNTHVNHRVSGASLQAGLASGNFPVVSVPFYPMYPARAGIPFWLRGSTSTIRTLTNAV